MIVALSRELGQADALVRSQEMTESLTPELALTRYLEHQPRLSSRKDDLLHAARPLFDALEQEESFGRRRKPLPMDTQNDRSPLRRPGFSPDTPPIDLKPSTRLRIHVETPGEEKTEQKAYTATPGTFWIR